MFLLHVNGIGDKISSQTTIKLFAGDALLCRTIHDPYDEIQMQQDLNKLIEWSTMAYALQCQEMTPAEDIKTVEFTSDAILN